MKFNLRLIQPVVEGPNFKKPQAASNKLDSDEGYYRIQLERRNIWIMTI